MHVQFFVIEITIRAPALASISVEIMRAPRSCEEALAPIRIPSTLAKLCQDGPAGKQHSAVMQSMWT